MAEDSEPPPLPVLHQTPVAEADARLREAGAEMMHIQVENPDHAKRGKLWMRNGKACPGQFHVARSRSLLDALTS
jgi:hypothetical protein